MKQFGKILRFELKGYLTNKIFLGVTVFAMLMLAAVMFFPRISRGFDQGGGAADETVRPVMLIVADQAERARSVQQTFATAFTDYDVQISQDDLETVKARVLTGDAACAFVMESLTRYTYYVNNLSMYDANTGLADELLQSIYRMDAMVSGGLSQAEAEAILTAQIDHEIQTLGKDQAQNYFYTYIMIMALYFVILLYGQMVATNVATEKSSRAMEVLITSAKPVSMMFGKVLASCMAGLTQLVAVFGTALVCFDLNKDDWAADGIVASMFDMPLELLAYMLVFFLLGFLIYAFLYGAVGSTASKLEDINTSVMPITMMFIVAFVVVVSSLSSGTVDTPLMKICSFVPFTSPVAMFTRIAMSTVPWHEIAISIGILVVSVVGVGILSAKIYRVGVLLYGPPPKMGQILKAIRKA